MNYQIEIEHKLLNRVRLIIDGDEIFNTEQSQKLSFNINANNNKLVEIWFWPWKIKPIFRINNIFINLNIAGHITLYDHKFELILNDNFFKTYYQQNIQSRYDAVFSTNKYTLDMADSVLGRNVDYDSLVNQLKGLLNK